MDLVKINTLKDLIIEVSKEQHDKILSYDDINCDSTLESLGLDSLDAVEVLLLLESSFKIKLDMNFLKKSLSFAELCNLIENAK